MINYVRSWLYVPGHRQDLFLKALNTDADAIVVDLEDAVPAASKDFARGLTRDALAGPLPPKPIWVRVNALGSAMCADDLRAINGLPIAGLRLPKVDSPAEVARIGEEIGVPLHLLVESALGVELAPELASAHPCVVLMSLGEADLMADLRVRDPRALDWARQRVLNASRASGLASPPQAVWTDISDQTGFSDDTAHGRDLGYFGRTVIHPSQVGIANDWYTPSANEVERAVALIRSMDDRSKQGETAWIDRSGRFVDPALVASARWLVDLSHRLGEGHLALDTPVAKTNPQL